MLPKKLSREFVCFGLIGVMNTLLDFALFNAFHSGLKIGPELSNVLSYTISMANSFILNKYFTFKSNDAGKIHMEAPKFIIINLLSLVATTAAIHGMVHYLAIRPVVSKLISIGLSFTINFIGNKYWTFNPYYNTRTKM